MKKGSTEVTEEEINAIIEGHQARLAELVVKEDTAIENAAILL